MTAVEISSKRPANDDKRLSPREFKLYCDIAPRVDKMFTTIYRGAWTGQYKNDGEKKTLLGCYVRVIHKIGGIEEARKIMRFLDSGQNTKHVDYPPTPMQFMRLKREIPQLFKPSKIKLAQLKKITLRGRIYSGITKILAGSNISKSHADIFDLVMYNFERYEQHVAKHGTPIPCGKDYQHYEIDLRGNDNENWGKK